MNVSELYMLTSFICSPVGLTWPPFSVKWASARPWFSPKWRQEPALLSWPTPSTSSSPLFASASLWCQFLSSCATSERLDSLSHPRPHPDDSPPAASLGSPIKRLYIFLPLCLLLSTLHQFVLICESR